MGRRLAGVKRRAARRGSGATTVAGALAIGAGVALEGCGGGHSTTVHVLAAASLRKTFDSLGTRYEKAHKGVHVDIQYGGSSTLAQQVIAGTDADVFAAADEHTMGLVTTAGDAAGTPEIFATNTLQIAVPPGNPARITGFADLTRRGLTVAVCAAAVPCGAATVRLERATGVTLHPVTEEDNVTAVLTKVSAKQVDAGIVYVTDVKSQGAAVVGVRVPQANAILNRYPVTVLKAAKHHDDAAGFVALVRSAQGQRELREAGFGAP